jgi:hypothetical protein
VRVEQQKNCFCFRDSRKVIRDAPWNGWHPSNYKIPRLRLSSWEVSSSVVACNDGVFSTDKHYGMHSNGMMRTPRLGGRCSPPPCSTLLTIDVSGRDRQWRRLERFETVALDNYFLRYIFEIVTSDPFSFKVWFGGDEHSPSVPRYVCSFVLHQNFSMCVVAYTYMHSVPGTNRGRGVSKTCWGVTPYREKDETVIQVHSDTKKRQHSPPAVPT